MEKIIAILVSAISNEIWKAITIEAKVYRGKNDIKDRTEVFKTHLAEIEQGEGDDDAKNKQLDALARTLLYGRLRK